MSDITTVNQQRYYSWGVKRIWVFDQTIRRQSLPDCIL